ncbi:MAG: imidazolonepropionase [Pseudomonadota bacterium]
MKKSLLLKNIKSCLTLKEINSHPLGLLENVDILIEDGKIKKIEKDIKNQENIDKIDAFEYVAIPGLIDCHTHLVFAGTRENEFAMRLAGKSYEEILEAGGGILSTVNATRKASEDELFDLAKKRIASVISNGVTTIEIKSGYGLNTETELKILRVIRRLAKECPIDIKASFLGAHAYPIEYRGNKDQYINIVINEMLPAVREDGLAEFCDVFCDKVAFSVKESEKILKAALDNGLKPKIHADQLYDIGAAKLAAKLDAVSAEHLHHVGSEGMLAMKDASVIPVLLPGASFFLKDKNYANARDMIDLGLDVAIATDFNPGSSMTENLPFIATLSALNMNMTIDEVMKAITINAAKALDMDDQAGSLEIDKKADILLLKIPSYEYFIYHFATNHEKIVIKSGEIIYKN